MRPSFDVGVALARLDEGLEQSPVERGNIEEFWFVETFSSLWFNEELVEIEDLVLQKVRAISAQPITP
ncbi:hypothetical protein [Ochrobactrum sp. BTU1]|uniref:hypothetical protein n=1 Tax=Ochrobactrum sp. BTU1 TaxID=2840456 RepID=UPI001C043924|nr:hypothetical protein KMS41_19625 [Ochrobactrum sp. BTU1]